MSIPSSCTVLVIGGGPGGSYAASALAREGVDTVLLEADKFPRYHIGESMLASIRYFLRFVDLEKKIDDYGFTKKLGAAFKYTGVKREAYTDFVAVNGPNGYAWNFIRSESDKLMFDHAAESGALTFDQTKVEGIEFGQPLANVPVDPKIANPGRPVSAKWSRKDGTSGVIKFDYLVDASGRAGIMSTKYLKNRKFNQALKNVAHWGYWKGAKRWAEGTERENQPMNEALEDASGWVWAIPLHDGTLSVGFVVRQDLFFARKKASPLSGAEFYRDYLKSAPVINSLIENAELQPELKTASDYSYNSPAYAGPNFRIVGDAGCFIDPYFSSGCHLAISSGLSAAMTIQAARRGDCDEITAAKWHSSKVAEGYTRFLLIVMTAMLQIRRTEPVLSDFDEDGFDKAFGFFQPVIQGLADADVGGKLTDSKVSDAVGFCLNAFNSITPQQRQAVLDKVQSVKTDKSTETKEDLEKLSEEELEILKTIRARQMLRTEDTLHIDNFSQDAIDGFAPRLKHGALGLKRVESRAAPPEYTESLFDALEVRGGQNETAQMSELVDSKLVDSKVAA